jgi:hypothetical protein
VGGAVAPGGTPQRGPPIPSIGERPRGTFWVAAALMTVGVWLHLTDRYDHTHWHEPLCHSQRHRHDKHHRHPHPEGWDGAEPAPPDRFARL